MKKKLLYWMSLGTILFAMLIIGYFLFYSLYPFQTVDYFNDPFPINNPNHEVRSGGELRYTVKYCRYTEIPTRVSRSLVNEIIYTLPDAMIKAPEGCNEAETIIPIPKDLAPGKYKLVSEISWTINAFRTITKHVETQEFTIIGSDK
jgi:hypothetical protein